MKDSLFNGFTHSTWPDATEGPPKLETGEALMAEIAKLEKLVGEILVSIGRD